MFVDQRGAEHILSEDAGLVFFLAASHGIDVVVG